ncbi:MAG: hypothetical protein ACI841_002391 [Planctomycetota bacterium]|jgi:uncharacterized protein (TIGR00730 family)
MSDLKRICVYCGSAPGSRPEYIESARAVGRVLAKRGIGVVYGGARVGTMGAVAEGALDEGGEVIGIIPHGLVAMEVAHEGLSELHAVHSMHERKALMETMSDGFITLPGGYGTHDETFEVLVWLQLGIHRKPVGLLNTLEYYDSLLRYLDHTVQEGFLKQENRDLIQVEREPEALVDRMLGWAAPEIPLWTPTQADDSKP